MMSPSIRVSLLFFLLLAFFSSVRCTEIELLEKELSHIQQDENMIVHQLKTELEQLESSHLTTRAARIPGSKKRLCGRRLAAFVFATCGVCDPGTNESLSTLCCARQCDLHEVIAACCPSSLQSP